MIDERGVLTIPAADPTTGRLMRVLALLVALLGGAVLALFAVLRARGVPINPEAFVCTLAIVPLVVVGLVGVGRQESIEIDGDVPEVRVIVRTWGMRRVVTLRAADMRSIRVDALGSRARIALELASGAAWPLTVVASRRQADDDARRIAERLGLTLTPAR